MCDRARVLPMASSQDHKRLLDGDAGPNTGGMGAYSPAPVVTPAVHERIMREVIDPTVRGLAADGMPFTGFLYAGLMIDASGAPRVIEYNVRFGDPEPQPVLARLRSDVTLLCEAALAGSSMKKTEWDSRRARVVIAAAGYRRSRQGDVIDGGSTRRRLTGKVFTRSPQARWACVTTLPVAVAVGLATPYSRSQGGGLMPGDA